MIYNINMHAGIILPCRREVARGNMGCKISRIYEYEIVKICFELCFVAAFKVRENTKSLRSTILTFFIQLILYLVVNGIRCYLRRKALLESGIDVIDIISREEFEKLLLAHYINLGYTCRTTPKTGDYGSDLVLEKDNERIVVQDKLWKSVVEIESVRQFIWDIKYYGASKGMVITNSVFTGSAHELARANGIELVDRQGLIEIKRRSQGKGIAMRSSERTGEERALNILPDERCPLCNRILVKRKGKYGAFIGCSGFPARVHA